MALGTRYRYGGRSGSGAPMNQKGMNENVNTNRTENFWSLLKAESTGTYISVEPFHLFRYVDEPLSASIIGMTDIFKGRGTHARPCTTELYTATAGP